MNEARQFWMVVGDGPARFRHDTRTSAETEAKRLAREHPDQWFHVVEAVSAHRKQDVVSVSLRAAREELPF